MSNNKFHNFIYGAAMSCIGIIFALMGAVSIVSSLDIITWFSVNSLFACTSLFVLGHVFMGTYVEEHIKINQQNNNGKLFDLILYDNMILMLATLGTLFYVDYDWCPWLTEVSFIAFIVSIVLTTVYGYKTIESEDDYNEDSEAR